MAAGDMDMRRIELAPAIYESAREIIADLQKRLEASEARAAAAERALDELRAALAPFAELVPSSLYSEDGSEGEKYIFLLHDQSTVNQSGITGADIARARALATPQPR